jgi:hypothetical protein
MNWAENSWEQVYLYRLGQSRLLDRLIDYRSKAQWLSCWLLRFGGYMDLPVLIKSAFIAWIPDFKCKVAGRFVREAR